MSIGKTFTDEREEFLNKKFFEIDKLWKSVGMNQEEELWMILNFLYDPVIDAHYDKEADQVDTTLAHMELDKILKQMGDMIDSSNNRLYINKEKKK